MSPRKISLPVSLTKRFFRFDRSKLNAIAKAEKLFVSETCLRFCPIDLQISFLALAIGSKKIQNHKRNLLKVVAETWG